MRRAVGLDVFVFLRRACDFDESQLLDIARNRRLSGVKAAFAQQADQFFLSFDLVLFDYAEDYLLSFRAYHIIRSNKIVSLSVFRKSPVLPGVRKVRSCRSSLPLRGNLPRLRDKLVRPP